MIKGTSYVRGMIDRAQGPTTTEDDISSPPGRAADAARTVLRGRFEQRPAVQRSTRHITDQIDGGSARRRACSHFLWLLVSSVGRFTPVVLAAHAPVADLPSTPSGLANEISNDNLDTLSRNRGHPSGFGQNSVRILIWALRNGSRRPSTICEAWSRAWLSQVSIASLEIN